MKVALGSDHAGYLLKELVKDYLKKNRIEYRDFGTFCEKPVDYPDISYSVVRVVAGGEYQYGILICGTGVGMAIAANKYPGIRAANCGDTVTVRYARQHNNANILTLGARVIGPRLALELVDVFLNTGFQAGRHQRRLDKINLLETGKQHHRV
jgi:ribose 5-phosphate isomerase B